MKTSPRTRTIIAIVAALLSSAALFAGGGDDGTKVREGGRILVLGFNSALLSDFQDRLVRERMMREFTDRGHPIVTVMELESHFQKGTIRKVRTLGNTDLKTLTARLGADYGITGRLYPREKGVKSVRPCDVYILCLTMYARHKDSFVTFTVEVKGEEKLGDFLESLARKGADAVTAYLSR